MSLWILFVVFYSYVSMEGKKNPSEPQKIIILTLISVIVIVLNSILL